MKGSLLGILIVLASAVAAGCGGSDQNNGSNGGDAGSGGTGTSTATGGTGTGGTGTGGTSTGGTSTGGTGTGGTGGGTSTGGGGPCGGKSGGTCDATQYCDFAEDTCGADDGAGTCTPRPDVCPDNVDPVCACDGTVYNNICEAEAAGVDVQSLGGCPAPAGDFPCGPNFCDKKDEYCQIDVSDVGGVPNSYSCVPLPVNCQSNGATCVCLSDVVCGNSCMLVDGAFTVTCPGG